MKDKMMLYYEVGNIVKIKNPKTFF